MVVVAQCLGLRVSEILALQWPDINFTELTMRVTRAVVDGVVDEVKTEYSEDDLPLCRSQPGSGRHRVAHLSAAGNPSRERHCAAAQICSRIPIGLG